MSQRHRDGGGGRAGANGVRHHQVPRQPSRTDFASEGRTHEGTAGVRLGNELQSRILDAVVHHLDEAAGTAGAEVGNCGRRQRRRLRPRRRSTIDFGEQP